MTDKPVGGVRYINCGDWVESCTAIAEDHEGVFHQIRWRPDPMERVHVHAAPAPVPAPLPMIEDLPAGAHALEGGPAGWPAAAALPRKNMAIAE
jgi:hypothetical protein